jgi:hypothetical protein
MKRFEVDCHELLTRVEPVALGQGNASVSAIGMQVGGANLPFGAAPSVVGEQATASGQLDDQRRAFCHYAVRQVRCNTRLVGAH